MSLPSWRVLLLDDDPLLRQVYRQILEDDPAVAVVVVATSAEALAALARSAFDVFLTDQRFGLERGTDLAAHVRATHPTLRIVLVARDDEWDPLVDGAVRTHVVDAVLHKPFGLDAVRAIVRWP